MYTAVDAATNMSVYKGAAAKGKPELTTVLWESGRNLDKSR